MSWNARLFSLCTVLGASLLAAGCAQDQTTLPQSRDTPLIPSIPELQPHSQTARSQLPEPVTKNPVEPAPQVALQQASTGVRSADYRGAASAVPSSDRSPAVDPNDRRFTVKVVAWVNSKPIFEDEMMSRLSFEDYQRLATAAPAQRDAEVQKFVEKTVGALIDTELLRQDAITKLQKNPTALVRLKKDAAKDAEKLINEQMKRMNVPSREAFRQKLLAQGMTEENLREQFEREFIANEYVKVTIIPLIRSKIGPQEIHEYYEQHRNEFQIVDRVKWQDIFIAVGEKHPTLADARQCAHQVVDLWRRGADINTLLKFDEGLGRYHQGEGGGETRGSIKPSELEEKLFYMEDGEIGPLVELETGIHVFRLIKREHAGVAQFDDKTQELIRRKLWNEMFERERRRLIHDLRQKAVIEIVNRPPGS